MAVTGDGSHHVDNAEIAFGVLGVEGSLGTCSSCMWPAATSEDCFFLKVHAPSIPQLEEILDRFLIFGQTTTSIVVSTPVPARPLPLPLPPDHT